MKILQINAYESPGRRFNGLSLTPLLKARGLDSTHLIWARDTNDPSVLFWPGKSGRFKQRVDSVQRSLFSHPWFTREFRIGRRNVSLQRVFNGITRLSIFRLKLNGMADKLERFLSLPSVLYLNLCCGHTVLFNPVTGAERDVLYASMNAMPYLTFPHPSTFFKRKTVIEAGGYNESYRIAADRDLVVRLFLQGKTIKL